MVLSALFLPLVFVASQATAESRPLANPDVASASSVLPCTMGSTRSGVPVVLVSAPSSPWAVVQLHVRVAGEGIPPDLRAHSEALAEALADGRPARGRPGARDRVARAHGETRVFLDDDSLVISDGVPAASLDVALGALDERLLRRRRVIPREGEPVPRLPGDPRVPLVVRQALAPAHPYAHPLTRGDEPPDAARLAALSDLVVRRDGAVIVVVGSDPEPRLRARVLSALKTTLPAGARPPVALAPVVGAHVVSDVKLDPQASQGPKGPFAWLWWQTPGLRTATPGERAAVRTLAALLGAQAGAGDAAGWLSWHAPLPSVERAEPEEQRRLERLETVARGELAPDAIAAAAQRVRSERLFELAAPEALARALGAEALAGQGCTLDDELAALAAVTPEDVQAAARALLEGGRLSLRGEGPPAGGGS